jgi:trigger factor
MEVKKSNMKYTVDTSVKGRAKFTFTVPAAEWQKELAAAYEKTKHQYKKQGFRNGHVPQKVLESTYGKSLFFEDAFEDMFPRHYHAALSKETGLFPIDRPQIDLIGAEDGIVFTAEVELKPEIALPQYKGLTVKRIEYKTTDKDVAAELLSARQRAARETVITDRPAAQGDDVGIDYDGTVEGKKYEGLSAEKQSLLIGSGQFIPGFETQLIGMYTGDKKTIKLTFPADYREEPLAGKDVVFVVKLNEIRFKQLPDLDDEFAKDVSEFNTLSEYKDSIRKMLDKKNAKKAETETENALIDKITASVEITVPRAMIETQKERMLQETEYRLTNRGVRFEDFLKYTGTTREALKLQYEEDALKTIKTRLALEAVIKQEKIEATDKEAADRLKKLSDDKKIGDEYGENELNYIKNDIIMEKLMALFKASNTLDSDLPEVKINLSKPVKAGAVRIASASLKALKPKAK